MASRASGYDRVPKDKYYTFPKYVHMLCEVEDFPEPILDPCAGGWGVVDALHSRGLRADGYDIEPECPPDSPNAGRAALFDFFRDVPRWYLSIITNPPTGTQGALGVRFVEHALAMTMPLGGKVAMLLPDDFDSAGTRFHIFGSHPAFKAKHVVTERMRWSNLDQKKNAPRENYAWYIWDWAKHKHSKPTIEYLPKRESVQ